MSRSWWLLLCSLLQQVFTSVNTAGHDATTRQTTIDNCKDAVARNDCDRGNPSNLAPTAGSAVSGVGLVGPAAINQHDQSLSIEGAFGTSTGHYDSDCRSASSFTAPSGFLTGTGPDGIVPGSPFSCGGISGIDAGTGPHHGIVPAVDHRTTDVVPDVTQYGSHTAASCGCASRK